MKTQAGRVPKLKWEEPADWLTSAVEDRIRTRCAADGCDFARLKDDTFCNTHRPKGERAARIEMRKNQVCAKDGCGDLVNQTGTPTNFCVLHNAKEGEDRKRIRLRAYTLGVTFDEAVAMGDAIWVCQIEGCDEPYSGRSARWCNEHRREVLKIRNANSQRARRYGITVTELLALGDMCQVCGERESGRRHHIHHDHSTGELLGLLCHRCNVAEGMLATVERAEKLLNFMRETTA